ncbi:uncharacterized protein BYT42DRAFT_579970 [Radiomyces spectabilis]|uniref:uncharacterized protein n=1 Tax=Radiomyces spectabilis TaxID=64574 RepID=UPI00221EC063|nr:uncharacterized protein BYT42DRAFT_579970 [Radiomyces spectabilis]KAI8371360.1 hypothetical protein BYT42DRAFT_579970 [Radiomyces spectabilis]
MKFTLTSLASGILMGAVALTQGAVVPRAPSDQQMSYPNGTDLGSLAGVWHLAGISQPLENIYNKVHRATNISVACSQFVATNTSRTTFNLGGSAWLTHGDGTQSDSGINSTSAGLLLLVPPNRNVNVSNQEYVFQLVLSKWFVNAKYWNYFNNENNNNNGQQQQDQQQQDQNGQSDQQQQDDNAAVAIPGVTEVQSNINTKMISTQNDNNWDAMFVWVAEDELKEAKNHRMQKRCHHGDNHSGDQSGNQSGNHGDNDTNDHNGHGGDNDQHDNTPKYFALFSKNPSMDDQTFNNTVQNLPFNGTVTLTKFQNHCNNNS